MCKMDEDLYLIRCPLTFFYAVEWHLPPGCTPIWVEATMASGTILDINRLAQVYETILKLFIHSCHNLNISTSMDVAAPISPLLLVLY
jgi:hypothetical protein